MGQQADNEVDMCICFTTLVNEQTGGCVTAGGRVALSVVGHVSRLADWSLDIRVSR